MRRVPLRGIVLTGLLLFASGACGSDREAASGDAPQGETTVVSGLDGPTQIVDGPVGHLLVAQLNGEEGEPTGQVLDVQVDSGERTVLLDGLDTPTGVLWDDDTLWVMERRSLLRAAWDGVGDAGEPEIVLDDLPFNGRSEGTLTALGDGRILYETSGAIEGGTVVDGSGALWAFDPVTGTSEVIATGLKNAYAHAVVGSTGSILTTEIGDNVADPPSDELQFIDLPTGAQNIDAGWPACPPPQQCPGVVGAISTFPAHSTPTGVAILGERAVVALFVTGSLVEVDLEGWDPAEGPRVASTILEGLDGPHTVLARDDGTVWVSEHGAGRVVAVTP